MSFSFYKAYLIIDLVINIIKQLTYKLALIKRLLFSDVKVLKRGRPIMALEDHVLQHYE